MHSRKKVSASEIHADKIDWTLYEVEPGFRRYYGFLEDGHMVVKTEVIDDEELVALNQQEYNDSLTQRFKDDPLGTKIASTPLNIWYRDVAPRLAVGEKDYLKWWLNHENNRPYRTFRGRV